MEQEILQIVNAIAPHMWWALAKIFVVILLAIITKRMLESVASYVVFFLNKDISKNVKVRVNGRSGYIEDYNVRFITIKTTDGYRLYIPITRWIYQQWEIEDYNGRT